MIRTLFDLIDVIGVFQSYHVHVLSILGKGAMMASPNGNISTLLPFGREFTGPRWIPLTKASDSEL